MSERADSSRLRSRLQEHVRALESLAGTAMGRSGILKGSLYERRRRCGRPACRCARGRPHCGMAVAVGPACSRRIVAVARMDVETVRSLTVGYRRMREARREMVRVFGDLVRTFDELGRLRCLGLRDLARSSRAG